MTDNLNHITTAFERGEPSDFPLQNIIILVLLTLAISLNSVQYSCTEFKAICKSRSFSANIIVSSAYNNTNNFKN